MLNLVKNEIIKIFKNKNIYILFFIAIALISVYNLFLKITNSQDSIQTLYERSYKQDTFYLENYENFSEPEKYSTVIERIALEKYAIDNNIQYNILLNSENKNVSLPADARILLMKVFNLFEIAIIFIVLYVASTIFSDEYQKGTIKNLLTKPHKRIAIFFAKLITSFSICIGITIFIILFQFLLGGLFFGFDSYNLDAIRYDFSSNTVVTMNLCLYMLSILGTKLCMFMILNLVIILLGITTGNTPLSILVSLGLYLLSKTEIFLNYMRKYLYLGFKPIYIW